MPGAPQERGASRRATLADVATAAGVDRSTASRILNSASDVRARLETRERVLQAARELNYTPNAAARTLRTARANAVGFLIPDARNPAYAALIKSAESEAAKHDFMLLTGSVGAGRANFDRYLTLFAAGRVDGLVVAGDQVAANEIEKVLACGLPYIFTYRGEPDVRRYVGLDDHEAAVRATSHLIELGHTRIGHLAGPRASSMAKLRSAGYRSALAKRAVEVDESLVLECPAYTYEVGTRVMARLMNRPSPPTAVVAANIALAVGALAAAPSLGFAVPKDVSVIAVHDLELAGYLRPPLTTVGLPLEELGRRAVDLLLSRGPDEPIAEIVREPIDLCLRQSTAPPSFG